MDTIFLSGRIKNGLFNEPHSVFYVMVLKRSFENKYYVPKTKSPSFLPIIWKPSFFGKFKITRTAHFVVRRIYCLVSICALYMYACVSVLWIKISIFQKTICYTQKSLALQPNQYYVNFVNTMIWKWIVFFTVGLSFFFKVSTLPSFVCDTIFKRAFLYQLL